MITIDKKWDVLQVELWDEETDDPFPCSIAWVTVNEKNKIGFIDYIITIDHKRHQGYGQKLVEEIKEKWPFIKPTDPISDNGSKLLNKNF